MKPNYRFRIGIGLMAISLLLPSLGEAGNVKKTYVNLSKEGNKAQANDIPTNYGQIETKLKTLAYNIIEGRHGSYQGSTFQIVEGPSALGKALSLNEQTAANDYLVMPSVPATFPTKQFTFEIWMKPQKKTYAQYYLSYASSQNTNDWMMILSPSMTVTLGIKNSTRVELSGLVLDENKWNHLAVSWDSDTGLLNVYKNGNLTPVYRNTNFAKGLYFGSGGTFVLGQDQDCVGGCFQAGQAYVGQLDEMRIWNVVRTSEQITQNFNHSITPQLGLAAYWIFE